MDRLNEELLDTLTKTSMLLHNLLDLNIEVVDAGNRPVLALVNQELPEPFVAGREALRLHIRDVLRDMPPHTYHHLATGDHLEYLGAGIFRAGRYLGTVIVGPFLTRTPDDLLVAGVLDATGHMGPGRRKIRDFYRTLTIIDSRYYMNLGTLLVNLYNTDLADGQILSGHLSPNLADGPELSPAEEVPSQIDVRYRTEKKLMHAIEMGLKEEALKVWGNFQFNGAYRVPQNPLRAYKNLTFVINTQCRLAAEHSGVPPTDLHGISERFAILIEKTKTISDLHALSLDMISEYCDLVKGHALGGYSKLVRKAIHHIRLHYAEPLTLPLVAKAIPVHPAHLSTRFKEETGMNLTEYISRVRIGEAKFLLEQGTGSVTDIALAVGFGNTNYFSVVFKKLTSMTPTEYGRTHLTP
ncbi:AraC family transcriptional regulator [Anaerotalea alkaliphila]|uniref:Helix-turn-helix transcriptional regulator n=1 Tax=Anaerotalea alkaliphila TaxID=2662126 RepID=A0A7X5HUQ2_9FIRM|nr:AraC family transcriptional regulator [Anaerotalea alkaliphila]NDL67041.1 helix-turn-helix transcriptional regulator [Anaerotalea alkaliphila]